MYNASTFPNIYDEAFLGKIEKQAVNYFSRKPFIVDVS